MAFLTRCAREYGDIGGLRFVNIRGCLLNHPDFIESVLVTHPSKFRKGRGLEISRGIFGNGLLTSEGEFWRRQRRLVQPAFHRERIEGYGGVMVGFAERMLAAWRDGETRDIHHDVMMLTLQIVAKALFDADVTGDAKDVGDALQVFMEQFVGQRSLWRRLIPEAVPTPGHLRYRRAIRRVDEIIHTILRDRRALSRDAGDLLSMLLHAQDEDGSGMTDRQLRDELVTLFLAGHETTAVSLSWTFALLSEHPEVESKLLRELEEVLAGRPPEAADLPRLPYTDMVVKESMRLYPPAYAVGRQSLEEVEVGGYHLPAGTQFVASQWVMHRDPRYYDRPERFDPDRWADGFDRKLPKFVYFPFGGGPRLCIGTSFAMMEAVLLLATIAQKFQLRLLPGHPVVAFPSITLRPKHGVRMKLSKRQQL